MSSTAWLVFMLLVAACRPGEQAPALPAKPVMARVPTTEPPPEPSAVPTVVPAGEVSERMAEKPAEMPAALADMLGNLSYSGLIPDQQITLAGGVAYYEDENTGRPFVSLTDSLIATGDLNNDGAEDAAAFFVDNTTGSADFVYLAAVLSVQTTPAPLEAIMIGDRTPVKSLAIEDEQVIVEFIGPGPDDAACCPTRNMRRSFQIEDGRLVQRSSNDLGQASLATLQDTSWRLVDLNLNQDAVPPETKITLRFEEDQISGSAGCNNYISSIETGEGDLPQSLMIGSIAATDMLCADPITHQETVYLTRLAEVVAWRYDFGNLSLTYTLADGSLGELMFAPQ